MKQSPRAKRWSAASADGAVPTRCIASTSRRTRSCRWRGRRADLSKSAQTITENPSFEISEHCCRARRYAPTGPVSTKAATSSHGPDHALLPNACAAPNPDADPLYWLVMGMPDGGADPALPRASHRTRMAIEDIGPADPRALTITLEARDATTAWAARRANLALAKLVFLPARQIQRSLQGPGQHRAGRCGTMVRRRCRCRTSAMRRRS